MIQHYICYKEKYRRILTSHVKQKSNNVFNIRTWRQLICKFSKNVYVKRQRGTISMFSFCYSEKPHSGQLKHIYIYHYQ